MHRDGERDRDTLPHDGQTLETIRQLAEELIAPVAEYEAYVPGSQKSLSEKLAPFVALDRVVAESFAALDDRERSASHSVAAAAAAASLPPASVPAAATASRRIEKSRTAPASAESTGGRLSVLLDQLQERARLRRQRGQSTSRLIKAEDFDRREPSLGGSNSPDRPGYTGDSPEPRLSFEP